MKRCKTRGLCLLLAACLLAGLAPVAAVSEDRLAVAVRDTAAYICRTVPSPGIGSIGGEWAVLGLARSGCSLPDGYFDRYLAAVEAEVRACGGVLHDKKYTEYSRVVTALSALGRDARSVAGFDLTAPLGDYEKTIRQGLNGAVWALIALDSRGYPMPQAPAGAVQATRQMYVEAILSAQLDCGGWNLTLRGGSGKADPDMTGMALQALAKYQPQPAVASAIDRALACMSALETVYSESIVQMTVALCELGIPLDDPRFVREGSTLVDRLMAYAMPDGGFCHTVGTGSNGMASEQALYGLTAALRAYRGESSLYRMGDPAWAQRHPEVRALPVLGMGKTFADIPQNHPDRPAIEALAARGIVSGDDPDHFAPDRTMSRAEFAAIVVRALGLPQMASDAFSDVGAGAWYAAPVGSACRYGITGGVTPTAFAPDAAITRQEAVVMVARAARLCGMETEMAPEEVTAALNGLTDGGEIAPWARAGAAFCCRAGIMTDRALRPTDAVLRCEVAQMLYRLLDSAHLL